MNIHEYQAKSIFHDSGIKVVKGIHCLTVEDALNAYEELESKVVAVKSQIHAGGRGKGNLYNPESGELVMEGGVKIAFSKEEVREYSTAIIGNRLVTKQTGKEGKIVESCILGIPSNSNPECDLCGLIKGALPFTLIIII